MKVSSDNVVEVANESKTKFYLIAVWTCSSARTWRISTTFGRIENVSIVAVDIILLLLNLCNHPCHLARR